MSCLHHFLNILTVNREFKSLPIMSRWPLSLAIQLLLHKLAFPIIAPKVQNYTLTAIEYLSRHQPGRFDCIFLDVGNGSYFDPDFQDLIRSPRLDHIVKYVIIDHTLLNFRVGLPLSPALVVINVHANWVDFHTDQFAMDPNTRILILFEIGCGHSVYLSMRYFFEGTHFPRIACIESAEMVFIRVVHDGSLAGFWMELEPSLLFVSLFRDMEGKEIRYSGIARLTSREENWIEESAKYLNATTKYMRNSCSDRLGLHDNDCFSKFAISQRIVISLDCLVLSSLLSGMYSSSFSVMPFTNVFAIPLPRSINVLEMFFWPFTLAAWIALTMIVISLELIHLVNPRLFKNNPTLLIICGFERYDLHRSSVREKLVFLALIIFFFLMTNAYEIRIISFMIEKPTIKKIKTVQDLVNSGLQLAAEKASKPGIFNDSSFKDILLDISNNRRLVDDLDGENAYYGTADYMNVRVQMPVNFDYAKQRPAYYILDETDGMAICWRWSPGRDSLMDVFYFTERIFFEVGLLDKWKRDDDDEFNAFQRKYFRGIGMSFAAVEDRLDIGDMLPAWIAMGIGLVVSLLAFVGEVIGGKRIRCRKVVF